MTTNQFQAALEHLESCQKLWESDSKDLEESEAKDKLLNLMINILSSQGYSVSYTAMDSDELEPWDYR